MASNSDYIPHLGDRECGAGIERVRAENTAVHFFEKRSP